MQPYSQTSIKYLVQASTQGTFWKELAGVVRPFLGSCVTDIGGGLGFLANELGLPVTVVERDPLACGYLRAHHGPLVRILEGDAHRLKPEREEGDVVCCNYGSLLEDLVLARRWGRRNLILVVRDHEGHRFTSGERPNPARRMRLLLESLDIPYKERQLVADMGQPFKNEAEVREFSELYHHQGTFPVRKREGDFPLWLSMVRKLAILVVSISDIPDFSSKRTMLVEGLQGVGKSTFVRNIAPLADGGFLTKKVDGKIYLNPIGSAIYDEAHLVGVCAKGGIPTRFDQLGALCLAKDCTLRVMDELGFMERDAQTFSHLVLEAASDQIPTICVIKPCGTPMLDALRALPDAFCIRFSRENRDAWEKEMERAARQIPEWPLCERLRTPAGK